MPYSVGAWDGDRDGGKGTVRASTVRAVRGTPVESGRLPRCPLPTSVGARDGGSGTLAADASAFAACAACDAARYAAYGTGCWLPLLFPLEPPPVTPATRLGTNGGGVHVGWSSSGTVFRVQPCSFVAPVRQPTSIVTARVALVTTLAARLPSLLGGKGFDMA